MKMYEIEVDCNENGDILIMGNDYGEGQDVVCVSPDQVETLVSWLQIMRDTIIKNPKKQVAKK